MGQKVNPISFRTGITLGWKSRWFASKQEFAGLLLEDKQVRDFIKKNPKSRAAGIDRIEIERTSVEVKVLQGERQLAADPLKRPALRTNRVCEKDLLLLQRATAGVLPPRVLLAELVQ